MRNTLKKRLIALALCLCLCLSCTGCTAFAAEPDPTEAFFDIDSQACHPVLPGIRVYDRP